MLFSVPRRKRSVSNSLTMTEHFDPSAISHHKCSSSSNFLFVNPVKTSCSTSASSNSTIDREDNAFLDHGLTITITNNHCGMESQLSSTSLASEARFQVNQHFSTSAANVRSTHAANQRWQHEQPSPLATFMASGSQRSTRSFDSCPEMPRRRQDGGMIRSNSMDMASQFLVKKDRQTSLRDGGNSFYLNMVASNQNKTSTLDIDLYRPVGLNLNEIRRRRSVDLASTIDLRKPVGLDPTSMQTQTRTRRYSFDMAPSLPTRSAPESPESSINSPTSATRKELVTVSSYDQTIRAFQLAKERQRVPIQQIKVEMDDNYSVGSSEESEIPQDDDNEYDHDPDDLDLECVHHEENILLRCRKEETYHKAYDSDSESDLSADDPDKNGFDGHGSTESLESFTNRKPDPKGFTGHLSPNRIQMEPDGSRPRPRRARSSENLLSPSNQDNGRQKWRKCLEQSMAQRNSGSFSNINRRSLSPSPVVP